MKKVIDYSSLINGLQAYKATGKTFVDLVKDTGNVTTSATVGRYAKGQVEEPSLNIWLALHNAAPEFIPPPPILNQAQRRLPIEPNADIIDLGPERRIPVFDAGAGHDCFWNDGGYPVGQSDEYLYVPSRESDANTFAVRVHGNSMWPKIEDGDRVVVVPSRRLEQGSVCFVTNIEEPDGEKLIRRYYKYGDIVVLKPDNPQEGFELQIDASNGHKYRIFRVTLVWKKI